MVREGTELHERMSTSNERENPKQARLIGHRRGGEMA